MRFEIDAQTRGGLRVIPSIPNISRCWLEGHNGVGKTVAVRLLELVCGKQPYSADGSAWIALREGLDSVNITVSDFPNSSKIQAIEVELTPDLWPSEPVPLDGDLGQIYIDGEPSDHETLRRHLDVTRIGGDETVISQIQSLIRVHHTQAARAHSMLDDFAKQASLVLTPAIVDFERLSDARLLNSARDVGLAEERCTEVSQKIEIISRRMSSVKQLIELSELREQQLRLGPGVRTILEEATRLTEQLSAERDVLADSLRTLVPKQEKSQQLQRELDSLQTLRDGRVGRAVRSRSRAERLADRIGLAGQRAAVARRNAVKARKALRLQRSELASLPDLIGIIDEMRQPLATIESSALDDEIVAVFEAAIRVTASTMREGLQARNEELKQHAAYDTLSEIDRRIRDVDTRIRQLDELLVLETDARRKEGLLDEVQQEIDTKTAELQQLTGTEYSTLLQQLRDVEAQVAAAISRATEARVHLDLLHQQGGEDAVHDQIVQLEAQLQLPAIEASDELSGLTATLDDLNTTLLQRREELNTNRNVLRTLESELDRVVQLVARGSDYAWLRNNLSEVSLPTQSTSRNDATKKLSRLGQAARRVQLDIDHTLNQVATVQSALESIILSLSSHTTPPRNRYVDSLVQWYEDQLAENLSNEDIRVALFDGGEFERIDLINGFLTWRTREAEQHRRPIEAFSSGERAFAYMLAAILGRQKPDAEHRVYFLDEFGAFVDDRRRSRLWHFLDKRVLDARLASQIVVILPLQGKPQTPHRARELASRGYFAVEAPS